MKQQVFQEGDSGVLIQARRSSLFMVILFAFLLLIAVLGICILLVVLVTGSVNFHYGYLLGIALLCFLSWYFLRLFLWNSYGKELIMFSKDRITYTADYRMFQESKQEIPLDEHTHMSVADHNDGSVYLRMSHGKQVIETIILVPKGQFKNFNWEQITHLKPYKLRPVPLD